MALLPVDGEAEPTAFEVLDQASSWELKANNTTVPIEQITARSGKYGFAVTFNVTKRAFEQQGARALAMQKISQCNAIATYPHVVALRGAEDTDEGALYNYLVVTVGTDDRSRTTDVWIRMDHVGNPSETDRIDQAWQAITALAPVT